MECMAIFTAQINDKSPHCIFVDAVHVRHMYPTTKRRTIQIRNCTTLRLTNTRSDTAEVLIINSVSFGPFSFTVFIVCSERLLVFIKCALNLEMIFRTKMQQHNRNNKTRKYFTNILNCSCDKAVDDIRTQTISMCLIERRVFISIKWSWRTRDIRALEFRTWKVSAFCDLWTRVMRLFMLINCSFWNWIRDANNVICVPLNVVHRPLNRIFNCIFKFIDICIGEHIRHENGVKIENTPFGERVPWIPYNSIPFHNGPWQTTVWHSSCQRNFLESRRLRSPQ